MEERDNPPAKKERTLRGKGKIFDVLFRWPLLPEEPLEAVLKSLRKKRRKLLVRLGFLDT